MLSRTAILATLFSVLLLLSGCRREKVSALKDTNEAKYKAGQVWSYKTRPNEPDSSCLILKVEAHPSVGNIIHVSLQDLRIKNPREAKGFTDSISHMPFSEDAINRSVIRLLKENTELPDYSGGYETWKKRFEAGKAGIFTISLAEGADLMEKMVNQ